MDYKQNLKGFLRKQDFTKRINLVSKYYLSEGFLLYQLSKVAKEIGIDVDKVIQLKLPFMKNKTDLGFCILASPNLDDKLIPSFQKGSDAPFNLFWHPRLNLKFSCDYLDSIVRKCASKKMKGIKFDEDVAKIYDKIGSKLYKYEENAEDLNKLLKSLRINSLVERGVGTGNFIQHILKRDYKATGIDISEAMLKKAREKTKDFNVDYEKQDARTFRLEQPVECIYTHNFIDSEGDYIEFWADNKKDVNDIIKSIANNLKPKGYLIVHKKEEKSKDNSFSLTLDTNKSDSFILRNYLYMDKGITLRKKTKKFRYLREEFEKIIGQDNLNFASQGDFWLAYQKAN